MLVCMLFDCMFAVCCVIVFFVVRFFVCLFLFVCLRSVIWLLLLIPSRVPFEVLFSSGHAGADYCSFDHALAYA